MNTLFTALLEVGIAGEAVDIAGHTAGQLSHRSDRSCRHVGHQRGRSVNDPGQESSRSSPDPLIGQTHKILQTQRHCPRQGSRRSCFPTEKSSIISVIHRLKGSLLKLPRSSRDPTTHPALKRAQET